MNFFEHQERAKRRTGLLVFYFSLAIIGIIAAVNLTTAAVLTAQEVKRVPGNLYFWTSGITLLIILFGTWMGLLKIGRNGNTVAEALGGSRVSPSTKDADQRKLLNIIEEMSIASGIPVPPVYVLPDTSINAFAAGLTPNTAVIAVTKGALRTLDRDELQGVIAHEFSHIFNGDMRLNLRLIGLLNGILMIALVGRVLMRPRRRKNALPLLGVALFVIGYLGVFMSRLIKSAVSRQREFLADASGVQFTRNPHGLRDALIKIKNGVSYVDHPKAEEVSHLFFAQGFASAFASLFATHPPLEERIRAIDPTFRDEGHVQARNKSPRLENVPEGVASLAPAQPAALSPMTVTESVGILRSIDLSKATIFREAIPPTIAGLLTEKESAKAVVYSILVNGSQAVRERQLEILRRTEPGIASKVDEIRDVLQQSEIKLRLPLVEMAVPALRLLPASSVKMFLEIVRELIQADNRVSPFEFAMDIFLAEVLLPRRAASHANRDVRTSLMCVLSYLAHMGADGQETKAEVAFRKGFAEFDKNSSKAVLPWEACGPNDVRGELVNLAAADANGKQKIVAAFASCIAADGTVKSEEWEMLRAFCSVLNCPTPLHPPS